MLILLEKLSPGGEGNRWWRASFQPCSRARGVDHHGRLQHRRAWEKAPGSSQDHTTLLWTVLEPGAGGLPPGDQGWAGSAGGPGLDAGKKGEAVSSLHRHGPILLL